MKKYPVMQVFCFNTCFQQERMKVIIIEKIVLNLAEICSQLFIKFFLQFKDRALIRNGMSMGNCMFIARFSDQYPPCVWIKWIAENIKKKISPADKADTKSSGIFRIGSIAVFTPAFKIQDMIKMGLV